MNQNGHHQSGAALRDNTPPLASDSPEKSFSRQDLLVLVEQRQFLRGCLALWLERFCADFELLAVADAGEGLVIPAGTRSAVAILAAADSPLLATWLTHQVQALRATHPTMPIVLVGADHLFKVAEGLGLKGGLQGYIPMSSSVELAAAALRLVSAGGVYFPFPNEAAQYAARVSHDARISISGDDVRAKLTPREFAVFNLIGEGQPNKIIAGQLSMSISTVKAHVHNIITKLNLRNRTEVALQVLHMPASPLGSPQPSIERRTQIRLPVS